VKPPLRTKTLGTKVSEEEFAQLDAAASERGLTLSEWCRETLLASVNGEGEKSADLSPASGGRVAHLSRFSKGGDDGMLLLGVLEQFSSA